MRACWRPPRNQWKVHRSEPPAMGLYPGITGIENLPKREGDTQLGRVSETAQALRQAVQRR